MTAGQQYHPVTKEELEILNYNQEFYSEQQAELTHEILSRPDSLAVLEAWRTHQLKCGYVDSDDWETETKFIKHLRENPDAVLQELREKGVWKE